MGGATSVSIPEVKSFRMAFPVWLVLCVLIAIGAVGYYLLASADPIRAWYNFLIGTCIFLGFGLCGLFVLLVQNLVGAHWSVSIRRIFEAMALTLPVAAIFVGILYWGHHSIYEWSHADVVARDHLLQFKSPFLNSSFFGIRLVIYFAIWLSTTFFLVSQSFAQDKTGRVEHTRTNQAASAILMVLYALSVTGAAFDLLMSLEPHWFSTIYGVLYFAMFFQAGWAAIYLMTYTLHRGGYLAGFINPKHFHDIGKYVFAFSIFWAYIAYSQFMLYWYADLPEETFWYKIRINDGWEWVGLAVLLIRWLIPFLVMMPFGSKTNPRIALPICVLVIFGFWLDLFWNAMPATRMFNHGATLTASIHWQEVAVGFGFIALFFLSVGIILQKVKLIPTRDPRLLASIHHH